MSKIIRTSNDVYSMRELLKNTKVPYTFEKSGNSIMLTFSGGVKHYASTLKDPKDKMPANEINFIAKVKRNIEKNGLDASIEKIYETEDEIKFVRGGNMEVGEFINNCYQVDISHAYWKCAHQIGYIDKKLYREGLTVDKKVRLATLGTFAKKIHRITFNGKVEGKKQIINPQYPQVFFNCAKMVDTIMDNCAEIAGKDFILYWTDCVYVKNKAVLKEMQKYLTSEGFKSKSDRVYSVTRYPVVAQFEII